MSDSTQQVELLAIAFLVEGSLTLSYEWKRLFQEYIVQLLQRCNIAPGANKIARMAFVTYGTAETLPSPIVKKIYFTELRYIIQDIKDDSRRLGIGQTDSGGGKGMAALEGFATILDMFDLLRNIGPKDLDCRVIHVAASPPDSSEHPQWNTSPLLDTLTWELLPSELKKRNIQLSGINLSSGLPRFPDLYTQTLTGSPSTPWFSVRSQHYVFLSGFTSAQPQTKPKRVGEPMTVERTPETKRQKTVSAPGTTESPPLNLLGQTPPSVQASTSTSPPIAPVPNPSQPPSTMPQTLRPAQQLQIIMTKRKQLEEECKLLAVQKQAAMAQENADVANHCDREITKRKEQFVKLSQAYAIIMQQQGALARRKAQLIAQNVGSDASQTTPNPATAPTMTQATTSPNNIPNDAQNSLNLNHTTPQQNRSQNPQVTPARSISSSGGNTMPSAGLSNPTNSLASQLMGNISNRGPLPPEAAIQMQKLIESNRIHNSRPLPLGGSISSNATGQPMSSAASNEVNAGTAVNSAGSVTQPVQNSDQQIPQPALVWEGILCWNGTGSDGSKKEIRTHVSASSSNATNSHAETWPTSLTLLPAQTPAVSIPEFQDWIRRTKPVLCTFKARAPEDESDYRMLVQVMTTKRMYATASWLLPNGIMEKNVLIFPINSMGLCGAFFPLTGIVEMPKPAINAVPQISPAVLAYISQLPPEKRAPALNQIQQKIAAGGEGAANFIKALAQRHLQQQSQLQQNRATINAQFGLNPALAQMSAVANNANFMNAMGTNSATTIGNSSGMLSSITRPNVGGGSGAGMDLNYDVLQSFLRRNNNPEGNNTLGTGPS